MADLEKTVSIIFDAKDNVTKNIKVISKNFDILSKEVTSFANPFASISEGILKADAALTAFAIGGIALAFNQSKKFEASTVELQKVIGDNQEILDIAKKSAIALSNTYGESSSDILLSTANFKQAGFNVQESMLLSKNALDLVIAGGVEASQASELLISALKGFRAPASDATRLIDILNGVSNEFATDVQQLAVGMAGIAPIARSMGFSFEETAGILTPVIEIFRSGDLAANALKTGLLKLVDDSKPVRDALAQLGVSQKDANGQLRSGKDILSDVAKAFETANTNQKLFLTKELVGIEQSAKMVEVFDNLSKSMDITSVAMKSAGSASEEVAARLKTSEVAVQRFITGFENLGIVVGDKFRVAVTGIINGGTDIESALSNIVQNGTFDTIFDGVNEFSTRIGSFLVAVAKSLPEAFNRVSFDDFLASLNDFGDEILDFFGGLDLTQPKDLSQAIQGVVDTVSSLIRITEGIAQAFKPVFESIVSGIQAINAEDDKNKEIFGNLIGAAQLIISLGLKTAATLAIIGQTGSDVQRVFDVVLGTIALSVNGLQKAFDILTGIVLGSLSAILTAVDKVTFGDFNQKVNNAKETLKEFALAAGEDLSAQGRDTEAALAKIKRGITGVGYESTSAADKIDYFTAEMNQKINDSFKNVDKLSTGINSIPGDKKTIVTVDADKKSIDDTNKQLSEIKTEKTFKTKVEIDENSFKLKLQNIKTSADIIQTSLEWNAKINIAEAEASAQKIKSAFDSTALSFENTGSVLNNIVDQYAGLTGAENQGQRSTLFKFASDENFLRKQSLELQRKLVEEQILESQAKRKALESGDGMIQITADGLEPELEAFMWRIIEKVQIRANESSSEFLLGI